MAIVPGVQFVAGVTARFSAGLGDYPINNPGSILRIWSADGVVQFILEFNSVLLEIDESNIVFTADWQLRVRARVNGTLQTLYEVDNLYADPGLGQVVSSGTDYPARDAYPFDRWAVSFKASSIDFDIPGYLDDGEITVTRNETVVYSESDLALRLLAYFDLENPQFRIGFHAQQDRDNLWIGSGTTLPAAFGGDGLPSDLETPVGSWDFTAGIPDGWIPWDWSVGGTPEEGGGPDGQGLFPFENDTSGVDGGPSMSETEAATDDSGELPYRQFCSLYSPVLDLVAASSPGSGSGSPTPEPEPEIEEGRIGPIAWVEEWEEAT